jgi:hypothetical protein
MAMANAAERLAERAEVWVEPQLKQRIGQWKRKAQSMRDALDLYDQLLRYPVLLKQVELELTTREHSRGNGAHQAAE